MNYLDLFSGIGGFALGAYWAGMKFENHYASEIDPYCAKLYQKRFPDSIQLGDIRSIDCEKIKAEVMDDTKSRGCGFRTTENDGTTSGKINASCHASNLCSDWIITGGFPCQDISIAGKGVGIRGDRSGLWFEMWRIIRDLRPRFAIMENVGMLVHLGLREVLGSLAEIGYDAEWQMLQACQFGLPHRRDRMWIIAYPKSLYDLWGIEKKDRWEMEWSKKLGRCSRRPATPEIMRVDDGIPSQLDESKGLGNAIVPQIAEILFRQIKELF